MTLTNEPTAAIEYAEERGLSQEEVWALELAVEDGVRIEVTNGQPIEVRRDMTYLHQYIVENAYDLLKPYVTAKKLGRVHTAGLGYILIGTRKKARMRRYPDFSFIRTERIPKDYDYNGDFVGAPDLAVEVVSPGQSNNIVFTKVTEYLNAGTEEVWLVYPHRETVTQIRRDAEEPVVYNIDQSIETPLFPELPIPVKELFKIETP